MASKVQLNIETTSVVKPATFNGLTMMEGHEPLSEHIPKIKAMEIRDDDILLCSYPKSGTHWLYRVLDMLQRGQAVYDKRYADSTFLDLQQIERLTELDSPRILVTHVPFDYLPQQVTDKRTKTVHVYRNPNAALVSLYHQLASSVEASLGLTLTLEDLGNKMISGEVPSNGWFRYIDSVLEYEKAHTDHPICDISYEDMKVNPLETVKRLAEYIGHPGTTKFYTDVVEACSFKKQKETEESNPTQKKLAFYRKGETDDWKNYLTVAMHDKLQQVLKERASRCRFSAKYC